MTIDIAPGWIIIGSLILELPFFLLIHKFLISDFFYKKTGHLIYYIKEDGSRELIDSVDIFYVLSSFYWTFGFNCYLIYLFSGNYYILAAGLIVCGVCTYFDILIYLRIKFFYYDGDKNESEKRYPGSYPMVSMIWTSLITMFSTVILGMYVIFHKSVVLYCIIILLILMHIFLFPDYMNKVLPYDVRTLKGTYFEIPIILEFVYGVILFLTFFY